MPTYRICSFICCSSSSLDAVHATITVCTWHTRLCAMAVTLTSAALVREQMRSSSIGFMHFQIRIARCAQLQDNQGERNLSCNRRAALCTVHTAARCRHSLQNSDLGPGWAGQPLRVPRELACLQTRVTCRAAPCPMTDCYSMYWYRVALPALLLLLHDLKPCTMHHTVSTAASTSSQPTRRGIRNCAASQYSDKR